MISRDGRYLAYVVNEDGASRLGVMDLVQHADLVPPQLPFGVIGSIGLRSRRQAARLQPADADAAERRLGVDARGRQARALDAERDRAASTLEVCARRRSCASRRSTRSDGKPRQIPAWVYKPAGPGPHPVLISIHGGPEAQSQPNFSINVQQWAVELGYAVILPERARLDRLRQDLPRARQRHEARGLGASDIGALLDWIATQPDLDAKRVVVIGGSYGGYMVLASMTHYNDRLRGGGRHRRHQQLRHLPREHGGIPARPAPARVRRRARPEDARVPGEDLAAQQRRARSTSRCWSCRARTTRACRSRSRSRWSRRSAPTAARSGTSSGSTKATASQARQHRLLPVGGGDVPGEAEAVDKRGLCPFLRAQVGPFRAMVEERDDERAGRRGS